MKIELRLFVTADETQYGDALSLAAIDTDTIALTSAAGGMLVLPVYVCVCALWHLPPPRHRSRSVFVFFVTFLGPSDNT